MLTLALVKTYQNSRLEFIKNLYGKILLVLDFQQQNIAVIFSHVGTEPMLKVNELKTELF